MLIVSSAAFMRFVTQRSYKLRDDPNDSCKGDYRCKSEEVFPQRATLSSAGRGALTLDLFCYCIFDKL